MFEFNRKKYSADGQHEFWPFAFKEWSPPYRVISQNIYFYIEFFIKTRKVYKPHKRYVTVRYELKYNSESYIREQLTCIWLTEK